MNRTKQAKPHGRYIGVATVAERYEISTRTVWRWVARGKLPHPIRLSEQVTRWRLDALDRLDAEREQAAQ